MKIQKTEFSIPEDILIEVLKEFPVKSLLRLRCVCKQWLSIIDDTLFVSVHRARSYSRPGGVSFLINVETGETTNLFSFHPEPCSPPPRYIFTKEGHGLSQTTAPVEGLVAFCNKIWNPSTRKIINLPPLPNKFPIKKPQYLLGFNRSSNEYKVLAIFRVKGGIKRCVSKVLTLGSNSWREADYLGHRGLYSNFCMTSCCFNDILYIYPYCTGSLIVFDLGTEKSRLIPFPLTKEFGIHCQLHEVRGNLVVYMSKSKFIWKLEDEKSGRWTKENIIFPRNWKLNSPNWSCHYPYYFLYNLHSVPELKNRLRSVHHCSKLS
ncbi:putative F-box protein [Abeliophyllum distichum]|uniref:F-box protein n=1 Tax=Abeliophyllum distichum TaxID=126358 RepID=A0ABD1RRT7_9LAMI